VVRRIRRKKGLVKITPWVQPYFQTYAPTLVRLPVKNPLLSVRWAASLESARTVRHRCDRRSAQQFQRQLDSLGLNSEHRSVLYSPPTFMCKGFPSRLSPESNFRTENLGKEKCRFSGVINGDGWCKGLVGDPRQKQKAKGLQRPPDVVTLVLAESRTSGCEWELQPTIRHSTFPRRSCCYKSSKLFVASQVPLRCRPEKGQGRLDATLSPHQF